MVSDLYETLLKETAEAMGISELHPDRNNSCLIKLKSGVRIQIDLDNRGDFLILGSNVGTPPAGRYREKLLCQALKANELLPNQRGIFAYSPKTEHLLLFEKLSLQDLNGKKIAAAIDILAAKAAVWSEAIAHNDVPEIDQLSARPAGIFGLR